MPSMNRAIQRRSNDADLMAMNNQSAMINVPPIMKIANGGDGTVTDIVLLEGKDNKSYVINGYGLSAVQTAGTACQGVTLYYTDFWTNTYIPLQGFTMTPNQAETFSDKLMGLNLLTYPGTKVFIRAAVAAPYYKGGSVFYTEVDI